MTNENLERVEIAPGDVRSLNKTDAEAFRKSGTYPGPTKPCEACGGTGRVAGEPEAPQPDEQAKPLPAVDAPRAKKAEGGNGS